MASPACCWACSSSSTRVACASAAVSNGVNGRAESSPSLSTKGGDYVACMRSVCSSTSVGHGGTGFVLTSISKSLRGSDCFWGAPIKGPHQGRIEKAFSQTGVTSNAPGGVVVKAEGFDLFKLLGGRSLTGEENLKSEEGRAKVLVGPARTSSVIEKKKAVQGEGPYLGDFEKELGGLTGGWPGGETGVKDFVQKFPAPRKMSKELQQSKAEMTEIVSSTKPISVPPPLLMPGMTVIVANPTDRYYQYSGIVQRITDGKVGVLFEGGNWDKLITFYIEDLKRTAKGPPGNNPKSAILELLD